MTKNELQPWMLDFLDTHRGEPTLICTPCSKKNGTQRFVVLRPDNRKSIEAFGKRHRWCGLDRDFNIRWLELQYGQELDDKQRVFIHECMNEGMERDRILELLQKKRGKMPAQTVVDPSWVK